MSLPSFHKDRGALYQFGVGSEPELRKLHIYGPVPKNLLTK